MQGPGSCKHSLISAEGGWDQTGHTEWLGAPAGCSLSNTPEGSGLCSPTAPATSSYPSFYAQESPLSSRTPIRTPINLARLYSPAASQVPCTPSVTLRPTALSPCRPPEVTVGGDGHSRELGPWGVLSAFGCWLGHSQNCADTLAQSLEPGNWPGPVYLGRAGQGPVSGSPGGSCSDGHQGCSHRSGCSDNRPAAPGIRLHLEK